MYYVFIDFFSLLTKQRLLSLLLVLNIAVSCLVICFSYGLYQNYHVLLSEGEQNEYKSLEILASEDCITESEHGMHKCEITAAEVKSFLLSLSPETTDNLKSLTCETMLTNDLYQTENGETAFDSFSFEMTVNGGEIVPSDRMQLVVSVEDYISPKKVAAVSKKRSDPKEIVDTALIYPDGTELISHSRVLGEQDHFLIIDGEKYEIRFLPESLDRPPSHSYSENEVDISASTFIPFTTLNDDTKLSLITPNSAIILYFNGSLTKAQYNEINSALEKAMGGKAYLPELEFTDVSELYYYRTVLLISVAIALLAAVNMAVLYRYILERRSKELAMLRVCGCSKSKAVIIYLSECMLLNIPLFAFTEFAYHRSIMPRLSKVFEHIEGAYSFKLYLAIFLIYLLVSAAVMLIMIAAVISKHSLVELKMRNAASRLNIMKIFEIAQMGAVMTLLVMICSAVLSRYSLYEPFRDVLESEGFMAYTVGSGGITPKELSEALPNSKILYTCVGGYYLEETNKQIDTITYCDEIIDRYKPELSEGIWLSESDESFLKTGYMPAVVDAKSEYKTGDIVIISGYENGWDENGKAISRGDIKLKIIGRLMDNTSIVSYPDHINAPIDHRNIYGVLNSDYEENDFMLMRMEDMHDFTGRYTPIIGNQFIFCNSDEAEEVNKILSNIGGLSFTSFKQLNKASRKYIFEQLMTIFPIALCIFILTVISSISISAIYTKRHLHDYAVLYICGATWKSCALRSLRSGLVTCGASVLLTAAVLVIGKLTFMKETVISFGLIPLAVCAGVLVVYLALSMIMPLLIIGRTEPREILKEE